MPGAVHSQLAEHLPSFVNPVAAKMLRAALQPWSPRDHRVWPDSFRRGAVHIMCVAQRLRARAGARCGRRRSARLAQPHELVPALPTDLWIAILGACSRHWWQGVL